MEIETEGAMYTKYVFLIVGVNVDGKGAKGFQKYSTDKGSALLKSHVQIAARCIHDSVFVFGFKAGENLHHLFLLVNDHPIKRR